MQIDNHNEIHYTSEGGRSNSDIAMCWHNVKQTELSETMKGHDDVSWSHHAALPGPKISI